MTFVRDPNKPMPELPPNFDPAKPLKHRVQELFCLAVATGPPGKSKTACLLEVRKYAITRKAASANSSYLMSKPEINARIGWLSDNLESIVDPIGQPSGPSVQSLNPYIPEEIKRNNSSSGPVEPLTRAQLIQDLTRLYRSADGKEKLDLAKEISKLEGFSDGQDAGQVPPDVLIGHILRFQGMTPEQVAACMGGPDYLLRKVAGVLGVTLAGLADLIRASLRAEQHGTAAPDGPKMDTSPDATQEIAKD